MLNIYKRWKRKSVFSNIYKKNLWGGKKGEIYSGAGSYREEFVREYSVYIKEFVKKNRINTIVDLGCGDFNVASNFAADVKNYIGIDIVEDVINRNSAKFSGDKIHFLCMDIVEEDLPNADLCLIRQVLQHCTNEEIKHILEKCKKYKNILVTENVWNKEKAAGYNCDILADRRTRRAQKSGVYLEEEPFCQKVEIVKKWVYGENEDLIMYLIKNE